MADGADLRTDRLERENAILREGLEEIVLLKDHQSLSYEKWELMADVAVKALALAGG